MVNVGKIVVNVGKIPIFLPFWVRKVTLRNQVETFFLATCGNSQHRCTAVQLRVLGESFVGKSRNDVGTNVLGIHPKEPIESELMRWWNSGVATGGPFSDQPINIGLKERWKKQETRSVTPIIPFSGEHRLLAAQARKYPGFHWFPHAHHVCIAWYSVSSSAHHIP